MSILSAKHIPESEALKNSLIERMARGLDALNDIGQKVASQIKASEAEILELIYEQAQNLTQCKDMYIALYDEKTKEIRFGLYLKSGQRKPLPPRIFDENNRGKTEEIILTQQPILHKTKQESEEWYSHPGRQEFIGIIPGSWLGVPMIVRGQTIGVIAIYNIEQEYVYDEVDLEIFLTLASQAAIALENAGLYEDIERRLKHKEIVQAITNAVREYTNLTQVIQSILEAIRSQIQVSAVSFQTLDETKKELEIRASLSTAAEKQRLLRFETNQLESKIIADKIGTKEVFYEHVLADTQSGLAIPVRDKGSGLLGVLLIEHTDPNYFQDEHAELGYLIADQASIIIQQAKMAEERTRESQLAALGAAMAAIQHRINNTINLIPSNLKLLKMQLDLSDNDILGPLDIIERNAGYATQYIKKIQEFLQEQQIGLANISTLLKEAHTRTEQLYQDRRSIENISVDFDLAEDCYAEVPLAKITEVFRNVIENSYQAMPEEGGNLCLSVDQIGQDILVRITNTGSTIPGDKLKRLLREPVPPKNQSEGTGLGLWLSGILLQRYGGDIRIANRKSGDGIDVFIRLPAIDTN